LPFSLEATLQRSLTVKKAECLLMLAAQMLLKAQIGR
jgi:hypothetical protein